jgi:hypothetical protein
MRNKMPENKRTRLKVLITVISILVIGILSGIGIEYYYLGRFRSHFEPEPMLLEIPRMSFRTATVMMGQLGGWALVLLISIAFIVSGFIWKRVRLLALLGALILAVYWAGIIWAYWAIVAHEYK